jgi:hypothetical protein
MTESGGGEMYLGGFYSPIRVGVGQGIGGGIYATDRQLFILGHGKATFPSRLNKISPGSDKGDFVPVTLSADQNEAMIRALSENKLFEIGKDMISRIEVNKPPGILRTGWLKLFSGEKQISAIKVSGKNEYEWTVRIVQAFKPEAVTLD